MKFTVFIISALFILIEIKADQSNNTENFSSINGTLPILPLPAVSNVPTPVK